MSEVNKPELLYEAAPSVSAAFTKEFNRIVPEAPCGGGARKLRYVWGNDRTEMVAGFEERRYADLDNDPAKYVGRCRWILEGWQSPDVYNKEEWLGAEHLLGPWPANGVWDCIEIHEDADGNYLPLDHTAIARVQSWHFWHSKGHARSVEHLLEQKMMRWTLQQQRRDAAAKKVSTQFGEDVIRVFEDNKNPVSSLPAQKQEKGFKKTAGGILVPV